MDEKKCNGLGEGIISDLGLADFDLDANTVPNFIIICEIF